MLKWEAGGKRKPAYACGTLHSGAENGTKKEEDPRKNCKCKDVQIAARISKFYT
jgi:hypothetical protein